MAKLWAMLVASAIALLVVGGPARADWLSRLSAAGERIGVRSVPVGTLESAARHLQSLPAGQKAGALAAGVGHEGHWTFVNRQGERFTASTPEELKRAASVLAPEAAAGRATLILTEDTAFLHKARMQDLPKDAELRIAVGAESYPLARRSAPAGERLFAEVRPNVVVELGERRLFDEAVWQLARPLDKARVRLLSLEPGGPETLSRAPKREQATGRVLADVVDPYKLPAALAALRGQTALVTGRIEGELLHFRPASGPEKSVILQDLKQAAEASDVNLIVLESGAPRQPGGRNWLWQRIEVAGLDTAMQRTNLSDFLNALGTVDSRLVVAVESSATDRIRLRATPIKGSVTAPSSSVIGDKLAEIVSELTGKVVSAAIEADMRSSGRERELEARIVPGIPSILQYGYVGALLLGLVGLPVALGWWRRIWPTEQRGEYAGAGGYLAARAVRFAAFALVFLPLVALPAAVLHLLQQGWSLVTWPVRLGRRLLRGGARQAR